MITASVVSHGQRVLFATLLRDLARMRPAPLRRLVITLNIPEPEPAVTQAPFDVVIIRNPTSLGFAANHNRAFAHCETPWFVVLNPDLRAQTDFLQPLLDAAQPGDAVLAPRVLESDGSTADSARMLPTPLRIARRRLANRTGDDPHAFDWLAGMCLLIRSEAFRAVGGFDERYRLYCEDVDLCLRLRLAGWQLRRVASAVVTHDAQRASRRSPRHFGWHVSSMLKLWTSGAYWSYLVRRNELRSGA